MNQKIDKVIKEMDGLELQFTKLCKVYENLGEELKNTSRLMFSQVDTIELGLWISEVVCNYSKQGDILFHEHLAEQLKDKFILIDKPEVIYPDDCACEHHSKDASN